MDGIESVTTGPCGGMVDSAWQLPTLARVRPGTAHLGALAHTRAGRLAWCWLRHPIKSHEFPATAERLVRADELYVSTARHDGSDNAGS